MINNVDYFKRLYEDWKSVNETSSIDQISSIVLSYTTEVLNYQKCLLFFHDDNTGLFKIAHHRGYENPLHLKLLGMINLLLSGEVVETMRLGGDPIIHTVDEPNELVSKLLKGLFLEEAFMELFGGDVEVPFGILVVGNEGEDGYTRVSEPFTRNALQNMITHLSNAVNTVVFYRAWEMEKQHLNNNIELRTRELLEQKEQFEAIYRSSKDGIAILDVHTTAFLDANQAYLEMTGFTHTELLRKSCLMLTLPEDVEKSKEMLQLTIQNGFVKDFVKTCLVKDGRKVIVNMSLALMHNKQHLLVTAKDMTEQYQLEQELRQFADNLEQKVADRTQELEAALEKSKAAMIAKSNFLATMSHEIRTPMNGVLGMANLLMETTLDDEQKHLVAVLQTSGQTLVTIINDILDFSKIEAGKLVLEQTAMSLKKLTDEIGDLFNNQAASKGLELKIEIDDRLPELVMCDSTRIRQIFFNLMANAVKFTHEGHIQLELKCGDKKDYYEAVIRDTGIGMSKDVQTKLFTPFTQADASITRQYGGTGLGLAICAKLVDLMGGDIWVASEPGYGSSFHFTFIAPSADEQIQKKAVHKVEVQNLSHLSVLIVEDNAANRLLATKFLQRFGINSDSANDGLEALDAVKAKDYDIILMDMQMPNMDGITATKHIREMATIIQPKIVALTANAFAEDQAACQVAGMDAFISKPIDFKHFSKTLTEMADRISL